MGTIYNQTQINLPGKVFMANSLERLIKQSGWSALTSARGNRRDYCLWIDHATEPEPKVIFGPTDAPSDLTQARLVKEELCGATLLEVWLLTLFCYWRPEHERRLSQNIRTLCRGTRTPDQSYLTLAWRDSELRLGTFCLGADDESSVRDRLVRLVA